MTMKNLITYDDCGLGTCYGRDVSQARNISCVKAILRKYCEECEEEKIGKYDEYFFRDIRDIPRFFNDADEAQNYISEALSENKEINPEGISLIYSEGKVLFVPKAPWESSEAERNLTYEKLCELMDRVDTYLGVDAPDFY